MGTIENPPPEALDSPGKCGICDETLTLREVSEHLINEHGMDPSDLKIEVSDTPFED